MKLKNTGLIIKSKLTEKFTTIPNSVLNDPKLSWKAKGILCNYYLIKVTGRSINHNYNNFQVMVGIVQPQDSMNLLKEVILLQ